MPANGRWELIRRLKVNQKCRLEELSVIGKMLVIVWIVTFCWLNYISMEFEDCLQIGSGPVWLPEDRKVEEKITEYNQTFSLTGAQWNMKSRANDTFWGLYFHNICKWPSPENKFFIRIKFYNIGEIFTFQKEYPQNYG